MDLAQPTFHMLRRRIQFDERPSILYEEFSEHILVVNHRNP